MDRSRHGVSLGICFSGAVWPTTGMICTRIREGKGVFRFYVR